MAKNKESGQEQVNNAGWNSWNQRTFRLVIFAAIIIVAGLGTVRASETTEPGDALYPVKLLAEDVQLGLTTDDQAEADLQTEFAENRLEERESLEESLEQLRDVFNGEEPIEETIAEETPQTEEAPLPETPAEQEVAELIEEVEQDFTEKIEAMRNTADKMEAAGNVRAAEALRVRIQELEAQSIQQ